MERFAWLLPALAIVAGFAMAVQPAANGTLAQRCEHPLQASIISFGTGLIALCIVASVLRVGWPVPSKFVGLAPWAWTGGLMGTYMVTVSLLVAPRLGAANWIALVVAGQLGLSLALDHFGWLGFAPEPLTWPRFVGACCLAAGVFLVLRG
ncbi:MAG: DMT family transporter [Aureliella sp.]|jgi:transporter family-2 protein